MLAIDKSSNRTVNPRRKTKGNKLDIMSQHVSSENEYRNRSVANAKALEALEKHERPTLANISMNLPRNSRSYGNENASQRVSQDTRPGISNQRKFDSHGNRPSHYSNQNSFNRQGGYHRQGPPPAPVRIILPNREDFAFKLTPMDEEVCRETASHIYATQMSIVYDPCISYHVMQIAMVHDRLLQEHCQKESAHITKTRMNATIEWLKTRSVVEQDQYFSRNPHISRDILYSNENQAHSIVGMAPESESGDRLLDSNISGINAEKPEV